VWVFGVGALVTFVLALIPVRPNISAAVGATSLQFVYDSGMLFRDLQTSSIAITAFGRAAIVAEGAALNENGRSVTIDGPLWLTAEDDNAKLVVFEATLSDLTAPAGSPVLLRAFGPLALRLTINRADTTLSLALGARLELQCQHCGVRSSANGPSRPLGPLAILTLRSDSVPRVNVEQGDAPISVDLRLLGGTARPSLDFRGRGPNFQVQSVDVAQSSIVSSGSIRVSGLGTVRQIAFEPRDTVAIDSTATLTFADLTVDDTGVLRTSISGLVREFVVGAERYRYSVLDLIQGNRWALALQTALVFSITLLTLVEKLKLMPSETKK
jgi:hypothetical protein